MSYTAEQQESDRSFLVGTAYGRAQERKLIGDRLGEIMLNPSVDPEELTVTIPVKALRTLTQPEGT